MMCKCEKHGFQFGCFVCEHISNNIDRNIPMDKADLARIRLYHSSPTDSMSLVYNYCNKCSESLELPYINSAISSSEFKEKYKNVKIDRFISCYICFLEIYGETEDELRKELLKTKDLQ